MKDFIGDAHEENLKTAHEALVQAKYCLNAASQQTQDTRRENACVASLEYLEDLIGDVYALRFQPETIN